MLAFAGVAAATDDYPALLAYLAETRIDGEAFAGASGAIAINLAAGDPNQQTSARSIAIGDTALASTDLRQQRQADVATAPDHASAVIAGEALSGATGVVSINQASGNANTALNAVALSLAQQGIREADDDTALSSAFASAGQQHVVGAGGATTLRRTAAVEATALQGFDGVLQLNQIAGSGNDVGNVLSMSVQAGP
uniref:hypothetical protein n=1 Tax=Luteimonas sp. 4-12 TaxID=2027406 RepID=UPI000C7CDD08|nr:MULTISPECIES: hypothetical protein [Luteimonas]